MRSIAALFAAKETTVTFHRESFWPSHTSTDWAGIYFANAYLYTQYSLYGLKAYDAENYLLVYS